MKRFLKRLPAVVLALVLPVAVGAADKDTGKENEVPADPVTGIKMAENWELVRVHCTVCHSQKQFLNQRGTKSTWTDILRWMQESGGLWKLDPDTESKIITYLADNYGPDAAYRRSPVPVSLLPENPYETGARKDFEEKKKAGLIPAAPSGGSGKPKP